MMRFEDVCGGRRNAKCWFAILSCAVKQNYET